MKDTLQNTVIRLARIHYMYVFAISAATIVYHASNLVPPETILLRWQRVALMLVITTIVWYIAKVKRDNNLLLKGSIVALIIVDIAFASFIVYSERGMASLGVALYALPIAVSATLMSRAAIYATASLCTAIYSLSSIKYFVDFFNEGYKVQLYSSIGFYVVVFFLIAAVLSVVVSAKNK